MNDLERCRETCEEWRRKWTELRLELNAIQHAPEAKPNDGRPEGWTEAIAIDYALWLEARGHKCVPFLVMFNEGDWLGIVLDFPDFDDFVRGRG